MTLPITYRSYAKINLYLDVIKKRRDGYHNIETLFQTVSLWDQITFEEHNSQIMMTCSSKELDTGEGNLVYRAAQLLREHTGYRQGAKIHLEKHIPIAAGLAGGSGNAAATLVGLNKLWDLKVPQEELLDLALQLGSDVPYCATGGTAAATLRGEDMTPLKPLRKTWFVLVHPPIAVSASYTYNHPLLPKSKEKPVNGKTPRFLQAIETLKAGSIADVIHNGMEAPVFDAHPALEKVKDYLVEAGCVAAAMSGSGPTLFGVCKSKRTAEKVAASITAYDTSVVHSVPYGVEMM